MRTISLFFHEEPEGRGVAALPRASPGLAVLRSQPAGRAAGHPVSLSKGQMRAQIRTFSDVELCPLTHLDRKLLKPRPTCGPSPSALPGCSLGWCSAAADPGPGPALSSVRGPTQVKSKKNHFSILITSHMLKIQYYYSIMFHSISKGTSPEAIQKSHHILRPPTARLDQWLN